MKIAVLALLPVVALVGCAQRQASVQDAYNQGLVDSARVDADHMIDLANRVESLSKEQRAVMVKYVAVANAYRPHIADDMDAALHDETLKPYTRQLDVVHEFVIVQDKLSSDPAFNRRTDVVSLQNQMFGTQDALAVARQGYNFARTAYVRKLHASRKDIQEMAIKRGLPAPESLIYYSEFNGSESSRSTPVVDDDGD